MRQTPGSYKLGHVREADSTLMVSRGTAARPSRLCEAGVAGLECGDGEYPWQRTRWG